MSICKYCKCEFPAKLHSVSGKYLDFCSRSCTTKTQRQGYTTAEELKSDIMRLITSTGRYMTGGEIRSKLKVSSKTINRFKLSITLLNKECGMKKPQSMFEYLVWEYLDSKFEDVRYQVAFDSLKSPKGFPLRFDFLIPSLNTIVEADGSQHNDPNHYFSTEYTLLCDELKSRWVDENGYKIIRIPYKAKITQQYLSQFI